ncbi:endo alpha-1,4 polygalactosaminidase [Solwaraspora sp. WMMD1047]|uniref:endo alpha-1,4 polygalactosaminidase n=1 Tax=Solwaraspora sp. WMMD1047 TaxID=3016102 RepID=UPI0024176EF0|nr:endo alpha-1,4 polygalactosaminidase [Solwaraspora sp. WMMD1047]MDG4829526.1 endo alpha-1,4 polygalactosaminidase [Solwaraspora sp. WMMD1047]
MPVRRFRPVGRLPATLLGAALVVTALTAATLPGCSGDPAPPVAPRPWLTAPQTWQMQLTGELDPDVDAEVFLLDGFDTTAEAAQLLRQRGRRLICHVRAGRYEAGRPDAGRFPATVLGHAAGQADPGNSTGQADPASATGRAGAERWLDIRQWTVLEPILADRFRLCRGKGFDSVAPDDVQGYQVDSGFPLTFDDQLTFNRRLAQLARSLGLSPGLRNDVDQAVALEPEFDFAVNEECVRAGRCDRLLAFVDAGKPVFHVEYEGSTADFCVTALGYGFVSMRKARELGAWRSPCLR